MLEHIALIAAIISGLTSLTTSLRALGVSREQARREENQKISTGCRISGYQPEPPASQRSSLRLHLFVTALWYSLSVLCSLPYVVQEQGDAGKRISAAFLLFLLLAGLLALVWKKVLLKR